MPAPSRVQVPGAEAAAAEAPGAQSPEAMAAEIARLNKLLAAQVPGAVDSLVLEIETPHGKVHRAESKFNHVTTAELHQQILDGKVKLTDRHVLCRDGWYVNTAF